MGVQICNEKRTFIWGFSANSGGTPKKQKKGSLSINLQIKKRGVASL
jgi:hypothetical protein